MAWELVAPLVAFRDQLNRIAPRRDKSSDGSIGDQAHAGGASSHNPDRSGNPEWRDGDDRDEVRAFDADADLNVPGLSMEKVVQHLVQGCRAGWIWWLEYIIFKGRIWTRSGGWKTQRYYGDNPHDKHAHLNSAYSNKADAYAKADYRLEELVDDMPTVDEVVRGILAAPVDRPEWSPVHKDKPTMRLDAAVETTLSLVGGEVRTALATIQANQAVALKALSGQKGDAILAEVQAQSAKLAEAFAVLTELATVVRESGDPAALAALERSASALEGIASTLARS